MNHRISVKGLKVPYVTLCQYVDNCLSNKEYRKVFKEAKQKDWEFSPEFTIGDLLDIVPEVESRLVQKIRASRIEADLNINIELLGNNHG